MPETDTGPLSATSEEQADERPSRPTTESGKQLRGLLSRIDTAQPAPIPIPEPPPQAPAPPPPQEEQPQPSIAPFSSDPLDESATVPPATGKGPSGIPSDKAEEALRNLRQKMATVATEFAEGKINNAQFEAIYRRYQEQRAITEMLLARDPSTDAWKQVLTEGHTGFLRSQYESRVLEYILYQNQTGKLVMTHGPTASDPQKMTAILTSVREASSGAPKDKIQKLLLKNNKWAVRVFGTFATSIAIYSAEPSANQLALAEDLHRDFETANQSSLTGGAFSPQDLVFPQRALFESQNL